MLSADRQCLWIKIFLLCHIDFLCACGHKTDGGRTDMGTRIIGVDSTSFGHWNLSIGNNQATELLENGGKGAATRELLSYITGRIGRSSGAQLTRPSTGGTLFSWGLKEWRLGRTTGVGLDELPVERNVSGGLLLVCRSPFAFSLHFAEVPAPVLRTHHPGELKS